jgi:hypothetical protein
VQKGIQTADRTSVRDLTDFTVLAIVTLWLILPDPQKSCPSPAQKDPLEWKGTRNSEFLPFLK